MLGNRTAERRRQASHARYYDAGTGRFISQDPKGFGGGDAIRYRYAGNQPTSVTDPSGMDDGGGPTAIEMISKPFIGLFWTLPNYIGTLIGESSVPEGPAAPIQPLPTDPPQRIDTGGGSWRFQGGNIWV
jgi:RHS repeat-associated protein